MEREVGERERVSSWILVIIVREMMLCNSFGRDGKMADDRPGVHWGSRPWWKSQENACPRPCWIHGAVAAHIPDCLIFHSLGILHLSSGPLGSCVIPWRLMSLVGRWACSLPDCQFPGSWESVWLLVTGAKHTAWHGLSGRVNEFQQANQGSRIHLEVLWRWRRKIEMSGSMKVLVEFQGQKSHQYRPVLVLRKMGSRWPRTQMLLLSKNTSRAEGKECEWHRCTDEEKPAEKWNKGPQTAINGTRIRRKRWSHDRLGVMPHCPLGRSSQTMAIDCSQCPKDMDILFGKWNWAVLSCSVSVLRVTGCPQERPSVPPAPVAGVASSRKLTVSLRLHPHEASKWWVL